MKRFGLMAGVLTVGLLFSACSQAPAEVKGGLEAQFGTSQYDQAAAVAVDAARGRVYTAGTLNAEDIVDSGGNLFLRRYSLTGRYTWNKILVRSSFPAPYARGTGVDAAGNIYLAWYKFSTDGYAGATITKFSPARKVLYRVKIDNGINDFEVDLAGNVYVSGIVDRDGFSERDFLRKYDSRGRLVWERARLYDDNYEPIITPQTIPTPYDIGLAGDGSLYAVGYEGSGYILTKYDNNGRTLWTKTVGGDEVMVTAGVRDAYIAIQQNSPFSIRLEKISKIGSKVWSRNVSLPGEGLAGNLSTDGHDNVYLTGSVFIQNGHKSDSDLFVSKYTAAGKQSWTYAPRKAGTDERALAIEAQGDVYAAGTTNGKVNGVNRGNDDAFLLKLNSQGEKVWER